MFEFFNCLQQISPPLLPSQAVPFPHENWMNSKLLLKKSNDLIQIEFHGKFLLRKDFSTNFERNTEIFPDSLEETKRDDRLKYYFSWDNFFVKPSTHIFAPERWQSGRMRRS